MPVYISFIHLHYVIGDLLLTKNKTNANKDHQGTVHFVCKI